MSELDLGFKFFSFKAVFQITLLTAADTIPSVSTVTCTCKTSICVVTVCINVTVVHWTGLIAFIDIFTGEPISQIASVAAAVIAPNVVCAGSIHVTLMCPSCALINICMYKQVSSGHVDPTVASTMDLLLSLATL